MILEEGNGEILFSEGEKEEKKGEENNRCGVQHVGLRLQLMDERKREDTKDKKYSSLPLVNDERFGWIGGIEKGVKIPSKWGKTREKGMLLLKKSFP